MKAVILAAGEGARMGPFTASVPKVMIPVGNRPLLESAIQALVENGVRDLVLVVGYRRERIQSHFQDGKAFHARITYVTQTKQLGTAHAVAEARPHLDGPFLVLNGSNLVDGRFVEDLLGSDGRPLGRRPLSVGPPPAQCDGPQGNPRGALRDDRTGGDDPRPRVDRRRLRDPIGRLPARTALPRPRLRDRPECGPPPVDEPRE